MYGVVGERNPRVVRRGVTRVVLEVSRYNCDGSRMAVTVPSSVCDVSLAWVSSNGLPLSVSVEARQDRGVIGMCTTDLEKGFGWILLSWAR